MDIRNGPPQDSLKVPFFEPWVSDEDTKAVLQALKSKWLTGGPKAREFEAAFADYIGTEHAVSTNSCTAALHLSMRALDIAPGDEVIVPVLTFAATANSALFCGARPVFADIEDRTFNLSPDDLPNRISKKTKALIAVHYGGQPCNMKQIMEIADDHRISVVEDCAHSIGALYRGKKSGGFGAAGCFSFYPTKNLTTLEGGMITTNDRNTADKARLLREHAMSKVAYDREEQQTWYYDVTDLGYNYRMNEVQAALGINQLQRIDEMNDMRKKNALYYTQRLSEIDGIVPPYEAPDRTHVYHLYAIRIVGDVFGLTRDMVFKELSRAGIGLSVHYTPLHLLSFYQRTLGCRTGDFPLAERIGSELLSLPMYPQLTKQQMGYVIDRISNLSVRSV